MDEPWDLDAAIEASYDDTSMAEMEAYEEMLADIAKPDESTAMEVDPPSVATATTTTTTTTTFSSSSSTPSPPAPESVRIRNIQPEKEMPEPIVQSSPSSPLKRQRRPTDVNYVLRVPPVDTNFVAFTTSTGERLFLRCNKEEKDHGFTSARVFKTATAEEDIRVSTRISAMVERIKRRESRRAASETEFQQVGERLSSSKKAKPRDLWVDKYAPKHFSDLLSPERTNREVLRWLKSWDPAVFGREGPPAPTKTTSGYGGKSWSQPIKVEEAKAAQQNSSNDRSPPEHKAILICGPPGLGKTTLAHIVARHAGYQPFEINASDDRSAKKLSQKVRDAMQIQSMFGENKPNCIILDEIDGAANGGEGRGAINMIVKMIQNTKKGSSSASGSRVTRPIICICNNLYAPALRPLRSVAKIFVMRETRSERLSSRIKTICRHEHVVLRPDALNILCSRTDNDIRSCLNTLQFLSARNSLISRDAIMHTCVGHKDRKVALFDAWKSIFHAKAAGARRATQVHTATTNHHRSRR